MKKKNTVENSEVSTGRDFRVGDNYVFNFNVGRILLVILLLGVIAFLIFDACENTDPLTNEGDDQSSTLKFEDSTENDNATISKPLLLRKDSLQEEPPSLQEDNTEQGIGKSHPAIPPKKIEKEKNLAQLVTKEISFYPYTARAVIGADTIPLAYIDKAYLPNEEKKASIVFDACVFDFSLKNTSKKTVVLNNIYVRVEGYERLPEYELIQEMSFDEANLAYILMRQRENQTYPILFYVKNGVRENFGKIILEPDEIENITVRINVESKGLYTFSCFANLGDTDIEQNLSLIKPVKWIFDER